MEGEEEDDRRLRREGFSEIDQLTGQVLSIPEQQPPYNSQSTGVCVEQAIWNGSYMDLILGQIRNSQEDKILLPSSKGQPFTYTPYATEFQFPTITGEQKEDGHINMQQLQANHLLESGSTNRADVQCESYMAMQMGNNNVEAISISDIYGFPSNMYSSSSCASVQQEQVRNDSIHIQQKDTHTEISLHPTYQQETNSCISDEQNTPKNSTHGIGGDVDNDWRLDVFHDLHIQEEGGQQKMPEESEAIAIAEACVGVSSYTPSNQSAGMFGKTIENTHAPIGEENSTLTEEEIDAFIQMEQTAAADGNNATTDSKYTPQIGMEFKTREDAQHFFNFYAYIAGFQTAITHVARTSSRQRNKEITKVTMKCKCYGKPPKKETPGDVDEDIQLQTTQHETDPQRNTSVQVKTDCRVVMVVKEEKGIWRIKRLDLDHNHPLHPGQRDQLFSGHKYMTDMEKALIRTLNNNNIPTRKMISILSYLRGGVTALPYKKKDISNFRTKLNREITGGDMKQAIDFFRDKQNKDPTFFYKIDVDEHLRVKNLFWRDGDSLKYYAEYGDCVSFDTTYMTNKYNLPFAPFVGVTGHGHTCLFGCAFISDETIDTFRWVYETFLESMGNKHPATIITDQDKAMRPAIELVFPNTKHRNCLFHIKTKCYHKNLKCFAVNEGLQEDFEDIMGNSVTEYEFENLWQDMVARYKLETNKYFSKMWETRTRFAPVYFKGNFFPFLQSTSRSEGTNSRFKDNVGPTYSITSFLKEYQRIIDTINLSEQIEDNANSQKTPKAMEFGYSIELQAMELYNRNIFRKFMVQLRGTARLNCKELIENTQYEVWERAGQVHPKHRTRKYIVLTDLTDGRDDYTCICCKFNRDGVLCSHILKVMVETEVPRIPNKYIINRWRKKEHKISLSKETNDNANTDDILRFNILSRTGSTVNSKASKSEAAMNYLLDEYSRIDNNLDLMLMSEDPSAHINSGASAPSNELGGGGNVTENNMEQKTETEASVHDPLSIKNKGRPKKPKRWKDMVEQEQDKIKASEEKKNKRENTAPTSTKSKTVKKLKPAAASPSTTGSAKKGRTDAQKIPNKGAAKKQK